MGKKNSNNGGGITIHRPKTQSEFNKLNRDLNSRGYVAIDALKPGLVRSISLLQGDGANTGAQDMAASMGCGHLSNGPLMKVAWSFDSLDNQPRSIAGEDGKPMGNGYIPWGPGDNLPSAVYSLAKALPYTAAPLKYLADLASGLGVTFLYRFADGSEPCEYRDAGDILLERIEELEKEEGISGGDDTEMVEVGVTAVVAGAGKKNESSKLKRARQAYDEWKRTWEGEDTTYDDGVERHIPGVREFIENNNLDLHLSQCMQDDAMFDLYFPTFGMERGRKGRWDPKIVRLWRCRARRGRRWSA